MVTDGGAWTGNGAGAAASRDASFVGSKAFSLSFPPQLRSLLRGSVILVMKTARERTEAFPDAVVLSAVAVWPEAQPPLWLGLVCSVTGAVNGAGGPLEHSFFSSCFRCPSTTEPREESSKKHV